MDVAEVLPSTHPTIIVAPAGTPPPGTVTARLATAEAEKLWAMSVVVIAMMPHHSQ
jgi:hypothetical protein